ncbi:MAG: ATP-dependent helicase [Smithellaceae bacterium]|nr:ATP-dependent helicase [Smithellaceae bacterium]
MIEYDKELNSEQLAIVIETAGPMLVLAGAGSGKTRTLTYRVARLVESGVAPRNILLATFTNKAANAMLTRVRELLGQDLPRLLGGTFHHICHVILRSHAGLAGLGANFSIIDSEDMRQLLESCMSDAKLSLRDDGFPRTRVILDMITLARKTGQDMEEIISSRYPFFTKLTGEISDIASRYGEKKRQHNVVDFDDLILFTHRMLHESPGLAELYRERFVHILVDEYQDTDLIQAQLLDLLAARHRNLMVVGDDAQSIYAFRGANYANILEFPLRYPDCKIFKLETNYRSTPEILHLANICIENNENQMEKTLRAIRGEGLLPVVAAARDVSQQADFVAQRIIEFARSGLPLSEIAVLYRAHFHSMELQMELTRRGIPYYIRSGIRFFEQAHIKDVVAFLRIISNPLDEIAWKRILGMYAKVGPKTADKVWKALSGERAPLEYSLGEGFLGSGTKSSAPGLKSCQESLRSILEGSDNSDPAELVGRVIDRGYGTLLRERYPDAGSREDDLRQLADFARKFNCLPEFLSELALMTNSEEKKEEEEWKASGDERVVLSTIHQAKGLEWSCVMIIWCADGMIPSSRSLDEPGGEEEERRLFYVAMTRAKDHLYLVYPVMNYGRAAARPMNSPSRFIREMTGSTLKSRVCPYDRWELSE